MSETIEQTNDEPEAATAIADTPAPRQPAFYIHSSWCHVGPKADECESVNEEAGECSCSDPLHFHAWCRLPNQFEHREILERAMAAQARRARQLRNPETDAAAILEDEMDQLANLGDEAKPIIVEELLGKDWWKHYFQAVREVKEEDEDEARGDDDKTPRWEHVDRDQERFAELRDMSDEDRAPFKDEYDELVAHLDAYQALVDERNEAIRQPLREALMERDIASLVDMVKTVRVEAESRSTRQHTYDAWQWLTCTYKQPNGDPLFESMEVLEKAAPEVLTALQNLYRDLESAIQAGTVGNP